MSSNSNKKASKYQHIWVSVRVRPSNEHDGSDAFTASTSKEITLKGNKKFNFDQVFYQESRQADVYRTVVGRLVEDVMKGYSCTVFAYGQTGTGKTYTMVGDTPELTDMDWRVDSKVGCITRAGMHIFEELKKKNLQYSVLCSFMEIYNEDVRDLLTDKEHSTSLKVYEDKNKQNHVQNLSEITVVSPNDMYDLLRKGCLKRHTASTLLNRDSSRSHTVFTITVNLMEAGASFSSNGSNSITCGKLHLVDLAGSESVGKSGVKDQRAREAGNINQSLLTLGRVIKALAENSSHVPYRESKLTRILQDSLGGNSKTSIIATISPGVKALEETINTLEYAQGARNITNCPIINIKASAVIQNLQEEIIRLKRDLFSNMQKSGGIFMDQGNYEDMMRGIEENQKEITSKCNLIQDLTNQLNEAQSELERMEVLEASFKKTKSVVEEQKNIIQSNEQLINFYEMKALSLQEQAKQLKSLAEHVTEKELKLHNKMHTIYSKSEENQQYMSLMMEKMFNFIENAGHLNQQFRDETQMQIEEFKQSWEQQKNAHKNICNDLLEKSSYYSENNGKVGIERVENADNKPLQKLGNCLLSAKNALNNDCLDRILESTAKSIKKLDEISNQKNVLMNEWIQNSENEKKTLQKHFEIINQKVVEQEKNIKILKDSLQEPQKKINQRIDIVQKSLADKLKQMYNSFEDQITQELNLIKQTDLTNDLMQKIELASNNDSLKVELTRLEKSCINNIDERLTSYENYRTENDEEIVKITESIKTDAHICKNEIDRTVSFCHEGVTNLQEHILEIKTEKEKMASIIKTCDDVANTQYLLFYHSLNESVTKNNTALDDAFNKMEEVLNENREKIKPIKPQGDTPCKQGYSYPKRVPPLPSRTALINNLQNGISLEYENLEDSFSENTLHENP